MAQITYLSTSKNKNFRDIKADMSSVFSATRPLNMVLQFLNDKERLNICYLSKTLYNATQSNVFSRKGN
jgi:hypothetical protein